MGEPASSRCGDGRARWVDAPGVMGHAEADGGIVLSVQARRRRWVGAASILVTFVLGGCETNEAGEVDREDAGPTTQPAADDTCAIFRAEVRTGSVETVAGVVDSAANGVLPRFPLSAEATGLVVVPLGSEELAAAAEATVRSSPGIALIDVLDSDLLTARFTDQFERYPLLRSRLGGPYGTFINISGEPSALVDLDSALERVGLADAVVTAAEVTESDRLAGVMFESRMGVIEEHLSDLASGSPLAEAARALEDVSVESFLADQDRLRSSVEQMLAFSSDTCGIELLD